MKDRLEKYRNSKGISTEEMADKLEISVNEYEMIGISNTEKIDPSLLKRIKYIICDNKIIKTPNKPKGLSTYEKLNTGIKPFTILDDKINRLTSAYNNPLFESFKNVANPITNAFDKATSLSIGSQTYELPTALDFFKENVITKTPTWIDMVTKPYGQFDKIDDLVKNQLNIQTTFHEFINKDYFMPKSALMGTWSDAVSSNTTALDLSNMILGNKNLYEDYLDFNSQLTKSILGVNELNTYFSAENFLKGADNLTSFDIISGTTFLNNMDAFEKGEEADEILEKIKNDSSFKKETQEFLNEFSEVIQSEEIELSEEVFQTFYNKVTVWVESNFTTSRLTKLRVVTQYLMGIVALGIAIVGIQNSQIIRAQNETIIEQNDKIQKTQDTELKVREEEIILLNELKKKGSIDGAEILQAQKNVNLYSMANAKSKILAVIPIKQNVTVIKRNRIWILVGYEEFTTKDTHAGWVKASFFEKVN